MFRSSTLVTLDIFYYIPDYSSIINEFVWQTEDVAPEYHRVHKFLLYWQKNIDAVIQEILICDANTRKWRTVDFDLKMN
jgi:uncharacterized protein Usg